MDLAALSKGEPMNEIIHVPAKHRTVEGDIIDETRSQIHFDPLCVDVPNELRKLAHLIESGTVSGVLIEAQTIENKFRVVLEIWLNR
jgi:hypothetical protein